MTDFLADGWTDDTPSEGVHLEEHQALADAVNALEGDDTLAVEAPLDIDDTTTPGTSIIRARGGLWRAVANLTPNAGVSNSAAEALLHSGAWAAGADATAAGDLVRVTIGGTMTNNKGSNGQLTVRLRAGGIGGTIMGRVDLTGASSAVPRYWTCEFLVSVADSPTGCACRGGGSMGAVLGTSTDVWSARSRVVAPAIDLDAALDWVVTGQLDAADPANAAVLIIATVELAKVS